MTLQLPSLSLSRSVPRALSLILSLFLSLCPPFLTLSPLTYVKLCTKNFNERPNTLLKELVKQIVLLIFHADTESQTQNR